MIAIAGILMASFLRFYTGWMQKEHLATTRARLADIRTALTIYASEHGRLPCPASPAAPSASDADNKHDDGQPPPDHCAKDAPLPEGVVAYSTDQGAKDDAASQVWIGVLPAQDLRLDGDQSRDGWGNPFTYAVTRKLTFPGGMEGSPLPKGLIAVTDPAGNNLLDEPNTGRYVVISHGPTGAGAWQANGARKPCGDETLDARNCAGTNVFISAPWNTSRGDGFYDDVIIHDDSNAGGTLIDRMLVCNAKEMFYSPKGESADPDGCRARHAWEGACLQTTATDDRGNKTVHPPVSVFPPATSSGTSCGCSGGYTSVKIGVWNGGVAVPGGTQTRMTCPGGGNQCMQGSAVTFIRDPNGNITDFSAPDLAKTETILYSCVK